MNSFVFSYPTKVYFGSGTAKQALSAELGADKKAMPAYGDDAGTAAALILGYLDSHTV